MSSRDHSDTDNDNAFRTQRSDLRQGPECAVLGSPPRLANWSHNAQTNCRGVSCPGMCHGGCSVPALAERKLLCHAVVKIKRRWSHGLLVLLDCAYLLLSWSSEGSVLKFLCRSKPGHVVAEIGVVAVHMSSFEYQQPKCCGSNEMPFQAHGLTENRL